MPFKGAPYSKMDQNVCLNLVKLDQLCAIALIKSLRNFEGFTQNGCYGNQSQPLEVLFDSTDANNPYSSTKQDLNFQTSISCRFLFSSIQ